MTHKKMFAAISFFLIMALLFVFQGPVCAADQPSGGSYEHVDLGDDALKNKSKKPSTKKKPSAKPSKTPSTNSSSGQTLSAAQVYERNNKAVVTITAEIPGVGGGHGSGFFVSANGFIMTNQHVLDMSKFSEVEHLTVYQVITSDGRKHTPQIIKTDSELDIALIKIDGKGFPYVNLGNMSEAKVGEPVYIVGTPVRLEFRSSITEGIISGFNRSDGHIQTSAVTHGGNSGGPAFNNRGEVIGILVAGAARLNPKTFFIDGEKTIIPVKEDVAGISYLIPINFAKGIMNLAY